MGARYQGPIIDSHHHFWRMGDGCHPWLDAMPPDHPDAALRADYLPADYVELARRAGIVGSVHVEANWDPTDPCGETAWLDGLDRPPGIASRYVAFADLGAANADAVIERHAAHPRTVGLREILSWHPDPAKTRMPHNDRLADPTWRARLRRAQTLGLSFDLLVTPHQFEAVADLADAMPGMDFILNHFGSPMDRDAEGMAFWRRGLRALAQRANIAIKLSDPVAYDQDWTPASLTAVTHAAIEAFGPERCLFGSDYPVAGLHIDFLAWVDLLRDALATYGQDEAAAMFCGNAIRLYRMDLTPR